MAVRRKSLFGNIQSDRVFRRTRIRTNDGLKKNDVKEYNKIKEGIRFGIGDKIKSKSNDDFHYLIRDMIVWNETQIMKIQPIDIKEPQRNGSYECFIVVNDEIKGIFRRVK